MDFVSIIIIILVLIFTVFWLAIFGFLMFGIYKNREREERSIDSVLFQIAVPRNNDTKIDAMEQFFGALATLKKSGWEMQFDIQPVVSFEMVAKQEDIRFYIWGPKKNIDMLQKQVHGSYPDADILEVPEYNLFTDTGKVAYKSFSLSKENFYPIKTYKDFAVDPLSTITSAMAKLGKDETVAIQLLVTPTDEPWQKAGSAYISETKKRESDPEKAKFSTPARSLEAIESKISKPGFEVSLRVVSVAPEMDMAKNNLDNVATAFSQFSGELNRFGNRGIRNKNFFMEDFLYRYQPIFNTLGTHKSILNTEELATLFHFPNRQITTPHIFWTTSKRAPAPSQIPTEGLFLGYSDYRGLRRPVYIGVEDRMRHVYIIGRTGTGKSELLKSMIVQDIREGRGLCFMDPHGQAIEDILKLIPPERAEDVIYFDPADTARPMAINLLEATTEDEKHFAATAVINMMYKLFDPYKTGIVGPRFEHAVRNAMLTVMCEQGSTFIEVMRALTDARFVQEILPKVTDPIIRRYWTDQIAQTSDFHKSEVLDYITSKFGRFVTNKLIRNIIGQSQSSFSFRKVMDERKILLINLAKGRLGEENSNFLGLIIVPRILMAALSRQNVAETNRPDFFLYVDEFQNFATPDFAVILSEARKYRLGLCVANQFIGQVEEEVKNAIFGNVGTKISFRIGVADASYMAHEFAPTFGEDDLLNVERFHAYVTTIVNNEPVPSFSIDTTKDLATIKSQENPRVAEIIREMSRLKYGRDERLVEADISKRARL